LTILVTGASGFVGAALLKKLLREGRDVRVLPRAFEMSKETNFAIAFDGINTVVHLAARVHVMQDAHADPLAAFRAVNVEGTSKLARQAAQAGAKRFVFMSSVKVNGEQTEVGRAFTEADIPKPQDAYGISKCEAELGLRELAVDTGMEVVIVRSPLVYGPGVKANFASLMTAVKRGWPLPLSAVNNKRSLVALGNLVDFLFLCISIPQAANQTFMVSDGNDLSTPELIRCVARATGVRERLFPVPVSVLSVGAKLIGKSAVMQRLCGNLQVDISKAKNLLGWTPPFEVEDGLRQAAAGLQR
jgi:nucleoside-diphosphate-sugar epimerase